MRSAITPALAVLGGLFLSLAFVDRQTGSGAFSRVMAEEPRSPADHAPGIEFFEKQIRPLLLEHCSSCHGPQKQRGGLRLDNVAGIRQGGDRGPILVPGNPDASLLIQAVRYMDQDFRMPPKGKLKDDQIAALTTWVKQGAAMPREAANGNGKGSQEFDLGQRRQHWCYQPVRKPPLPVVADSAWCLTPVDAFIRARQEAEGIRPAPPADKRTLIRRLTFDLIGLPPSPEEVEAFLADDSPDAYERLVERLLASPHYGERWGRHWLDLMRYAETLGHEFDYDIHHAWRYRDYVIAAFNEDLPYDHFVVEHLAGDLLEQPRRDARSGINLSILGTGWFWLGEEKHSPVDARQQQADRIDNQIDVFGKAFLAQTLSCARCHDHKFDAISLADYYALAGFFKSSRYQQAFLDPPERIGLKVGRLQEIQDALRQGLTQRLENEVREIPRYLEAVRRHLGEPESHLLEQVATKNNLDPKRLGRWVEVLRRNSLGHDHPLYGVARLIAVPDRDWNAAWVSLKQQVHNHNAQAKQSQEAYRVLGDFRHHDASGWFIHGHAFGQRPMGPREALVTPEGHIRIAPNGVMHSGRFAPALEGVLQSPTFTLDKRYLLLEVAGRKGRVNIVVDGLTIIRDPIYGSLTFEVNDEKFHWRVVDVGMWQGQRAYVEFADSTTPGPSYAMDAKTAGQPSDAYIAVRRVLLADRAQPPAPEADPLLLRLLKTESITNFAALAEHLGRSLNEAARNWSGTAASEASGLLAWLVNHGLLADDADQVFASLIREHRETAASIPAPTRGLAVADGTGEDEHVFLRGNYKTPGPVMVRRLPLVLECEPTPAVQPPGSGRLELARRLARPDNPLLARVLVNRLWHYHFGTGLVRSTDDFGRMGEAPSHPDLLDYLAAEFVERGWSVKAMHRLIVLSNTYRMSGHADAAAARLDPNNRLWHHVPLRRLEAEAVRDAMLAVSGRLNRTQGGPGVPPYLTPYMEGRGRPAQSGPLDGACRRSVYLGIRRNFLPPMFLAFDYPIPFTTVGRRHVSNVPSQALMMMNDLFVHDMARHWARHLLAASPTDTRERLNRLYMSAFARPPREEEAAFALEFLAGFGGNAEGIPEEQAWADLCHVLFNTKEFLFVE